MCRLKPIVTPAVLVLLTTGPARAATVRLDIVPTNNTTATQVTVAPGSEVPYDLYVQVTSDNTAIPDNNGLAFFTLDVVTNLGLEQPPLTAFDNLIGQLFSIVQSLGTPTDDDILQIGGGQNTFVGGSTQSGIGTGAQRQLIGRGRLLTPATVGTFSVGIASTARANVFNPGSVTGATQATVVLGPGFAIQTANTPDDGNDDDDDDDDDDGTDDDDDDGVPTTQPVSGSALAMGLTATALGFLVVLAAFFAFGPLAAIMATLLFPLLMLLLVVSGS